MSRKGCFMEKLYSFNCKISELNERIQCWINSKELKDIVHSFGGAYPNTTSINDLAKWLLNFSERWDYRRHQQQSRDKKTQENVRWKINNDTITDEQKDIVKNSISSLGLIGVQVPIEKNFDYVIALGGARFSCLYRPQYMHELLINKIISAQKAILLSGMRPISESERAATDIYAPKAQTEYDLINTGAEQAFGITPNYKEERYHHQNPNNSWAIRQYDTADDRIPLFSISGPSSEPDKRRANSADTYQFFLKKFDVKAGQKLLLITSQIYVPYQQLEALRTLALPNQLYIETVGFPVEWSNKLHGMMEPANYLQEIRSTIQSINRYLDILTN